MTDYKKKKQLIDENKDMYISEYDKNLSYDALSQIVDAKKNYAIAAKNNDESEMKKYNNVANGIRAKYGNYTGGEFGDEYHPFVYEDTGYSDYESKYEDELDRLYSEMNNLTFEYDYTQDPAYQAYKKVYDRQGALAYDRALAENSLKTGGVANSHAYSAATQAMNYYNSLLASKIPELYEAAYQKYYNDKKELIRDAYEIINNREGRDYSRHMDELENYRDIRDFNYQKSDDEQQRAYSIYKDEMNNEFEKSLTDAQSEEKAKDRELEEKKLSLNTTKEINDQNYKNKSQIIDLIELYYSMLRDGVSDEKWLADHNLNAAKAGVAGYSQNVGSGDILEYARKIFGNPNLTANDLFNLFNIY